MAKETATPRTGRPPEVAKKFDRKQFEKLLSMQHTKEECAAWFEFSEKSLDRIIKKTYGRKKTFVELRKDFKHKGTGSLRAKAWSMALEGNSTMMKLLAGHVLGMREKTEVKLDDEQQRAQHLHEAELQKGQVITSALQLEAARVAAAAALFAVKRPQPQPQLTAGDS